MEAVGIELVTQCLACQASVAINGIVPRAACPKCARVVELGAKLWRQLLSTAVVEVAARPIGYEVTATLASEQKQSVRGVLRHVAMPSGVKRRDVPAELAVPGVEFVAGEDLESMNVEAGPSVVTMHCPQCGAPLEVAPGERNLSCVYCGCTSLIEEGARSIGRPLRRFHLACTASAHKQSIARWEQVEAVAIDEQDRVFVHDNSSATLYALDTSLEGVRWVKTGITVTQLAARRGLVVAMRKNDCALVFDAASGEARGTFPPEASLPFDPKRILSVAPMPNGSWLLAVDGEEWGGQSGHTVFHRLDSEGGALPLWGGEFGAAPELGTNIPELGGAQPMFVEGEIHIVAGFDGSVLMTNGDKLIKLDASGEVRMELDEPQSGDWEYPLIGLDGLGRVHALTHETRGAYLSFDAYGTLLAKVDRASGSRVIGKERRLAAAKAGGVVLVGERGSVRVIRPDGTVGFVSTEP